MSLPSRVETRTADSGKQAMLLALLERFGLPAAIAAYFLWKDWAFTEQLLKLMGQIESALRVMS